MVIRKNKTKRKTNKRYDCSGYMLGFPLPVVVHTYKSMSTPH